MTPFGLPLLDNRCESIGTYFHGSTRLTRNEPGRIRGMLLQKPWQRSKDNLAKKKKSQSSSAQLAHKRFGVCYGRLGWIWKVPVISHPSLIYGRD